MKVHKHKYERDDGWTLIEAVLTIVIMSIMVLGLSIVLMAFREHLDRSWSVRVMDQYGNDVVEQLAHKLRNAVNVSVRRDRGDTDKVTVEYLDAFHHDLTHEEVWRVDHRTRNRILVDNLPLDLYFPPTAPGRGESYEILQFRMTRFGELTHDEWEEMDSERRTEDFENATWDIRFIIRYYRAAINPGEYPWSYQKEYFNRVYMRNMNLIVSDDIYN
jgi:hypothetical protein